MKTDQNKKSAVFLSLFVNCKKQPFSLALFTPQRASLERAGSEAD